MFSAISAWVSKYGDVELDNDLQAGTMTVIFKSHVPSEGWLVALKIHGTRNVEVSLHTPPEWNNFRRVAHVYAQALELMDGFHLIDVEPVEPGENQSDRALGLRVARAVRR